LGPTRPGPTLTLRIATTGSAAIFANSVTLTPTYAGTTIAAVFTSVRITNLTNNAASAGWAELPGATGPNPHTTSFSAGSIFVHWQGADIHDGMVVTIAGGVPEPQRWALMFARFGLVGAGAPTSHNDQTGNGA
jgi:hypothetical protein